MSFESGCSGPGDRVSDGLAAAFICETEELPLVAGTYRVDARVQWNSQDQDLVQGACFFDVERGDFAGRMLPSAGGVGATCCRHTWTIPPAVFA